MAPTTTSAPATDAIPDDPSRAALEDQLESIVQTFYEVLVSVHGMSGPESTDVVADTLSKLAKEHQSLAASAKSVSHVRLPRDVIQYVEDGRNPDVYTREFVEVVVRNNQLVNGKQKAFREFRDELAEHVQEAFPELREDVERILRFTNGEPEGEVVRNGRSNEGAGR